MTDAYARRREQTFPATCGTGGAAVVVHQSLLKARDAASVECLPHQLDLPILGDKASGVGLLADLPR